MMKLSYHGISLSYRAISLSYALFHFPRVTSIEHRFFSHTFLIHAPYLIIIARLHSDNYNIRELKQE